MAQEKPLQPPPREPIREFQTPAPSVVFYTELIDRLDIAYQQVAPIKRGTLYSTILSAKQDVINQYPKLYFVKETKLGNSDRYVMWSWANVPDAEDTYNAEVGYLSESEPHPVFARVYTVRRDHYDEFPSLDVGSTLTGLIAIKVEAQGEGYQASDTIEIASPIGGRCAAASLVVDPDGKVISVVVTDEGHLYTEPPDIQINSGTGQGAQLTGIIQGQTAYLISQKKEEFPDDHPLRNEFVKVSRIYETLPGPTLYSTKIDVDGSTVTVGTTRKLCSDITTGEAITDGTWCKTTKKETDSYFVCDEIVECRPIPGLPMLSSKIDEDGKVLFIVQTYTATTDCVSEETLVGGVWTQKYLTDVDGSFVVSWQWVKIRNVPGNPVPYTKIEEDGKVLSGTRTLKDTTLIVSAETLVGTTWTKTYKDFLTTRLTIGEEAGDLVSWEIVESRDIPGNDMVKTVIDSAGDIVTETRTMVKGPPTLVTTITTAGGVYTKTFGEPISDLVSWKVVQVKATEATLDSYEAEIPDLLPEEFRPEVPVTTHEETLIGTASAITLPLATGVLFEKQAQIDFNTYRHTIRGRTSISLPQTITNKEITSEFGGGDVNRVLTLNLYNSLSLDEGLTVLSCNIRKIDDQANGLAVKTTRQLNAASWPVLIGTHVDEKYGIAIGIERQTVDAGTEGGGSGGTIIEVNPHDKWKSIQITSTLDPDSLPEDAQWPSGMIYSFPPELTDAIIDWASATCGCSSSFSADLIANMKPYHGPVKTRVTEQFYNGTPPDDVSITQFFPQAHNFGYAWSSFCGDDDGNCVTKSGAPHFYIPPCLHDDLTLTIGLITFSFPATDPAVLPHGSYIMLPPHVERWRFGVFRRVLTEVLVP